ncbi:PD-(D/E)XK nuclease family protein [Paragemmobacter straminiformis]|uniref:PD-(D/E)XK nuclease family protein n=1 Tax=Paragemmobacter straminiformis TaxID=2045119 RepID=A0A842I7G9_9RHOB|nr:PD-(D/E)XK nuclease family protein [Gemmobacter straminiformis]MBC2836022.1 PD-(D/E)XK nuclease family protein [Gemmobacter straminiformis]
MSKVFGLAAGIDFPAILVAGLRARMAGQAPEAMAGVTLYLNTQRMRRRVTEIFAASGAAYLPRLRLVTDLGQDMLMAGVPAAVSGLRRRLELTQLVAGLLAKEPDLAPRAALYDLADSLATLMDEMQGEGVTPDRVAAVDVSEHSAHWARTKAFLRIVTPFFQDGAPDAQARQRMVVERLVARWAANPPQEPVIVAGSTGSRGTTALLMQAVASLPQGALVLPGFDFDMPPDVWDRMGDAMTAEDHPQFRYKRLMDALDIGPADVRVWHDAAVPDAGRNKLVSLSLRPAPVTDQWLTEGEGLPDLLAATSGLTLIEAQTPRAEALAIALMLREAAENGVRAALVSPDRMLTRQVTAALDRWGIMPDDSAGRPLALSPPGRFLRHVAGLMGRKLTSDALLALLKHPLTMSGGGRGLHLKLTRELELEVRRKGPAFPTGAHLRNWAKGRKDEGAADWGEAIAAALEDLAGAGVADLADHIALHRHVAERLGGVELWEKEAGQKALELVEELQAEADAGGVLEVPDYRDLFEAILARGEVRESVTPHPDIMIWGTLEARVAGAELVILGGLNDGIWPKLPEPDPWLNRKMRKDAGLLLPERQIGLSAHDYQQAIAAPRVVLTRATRNAEAETVPSRWLNRLMNLMEGLPAKNGKRALGAMRERGRVWTRRAVVLEAPVAPVAPAHRPSPRPPVGVRPRRLAVTKIATLIRDPYAIYARYILRLFPLDPLRPEADAALRGQVLHKILEEFAKGRLAEETREAAKARLMAVAEAVLLEYTPWPAARALWLARLMRAADFFLSFDAQRGGVPVTLEEKGRVALAGVDFTLEGTPDRIDRLPDGSLHIIDYKTGTPPTEAQQKAFDKQLLLAAAMVARDGFKGLEGSEVSLISYVGLGSNPKAEETPITEAVTDEVWEGLCKLVAHYMTEGAGYTARRAVMKERFAGDYDHLSRYGEWETTDDPVAEEVGR